MPNENPKTTEDQACDNAGCFRATTPTYRERTIRAEAVIKALNRDIEAMKTIGDERVEEIASLLVVLDNLQTHHSDMIKSFDAHFIQALKRNNLTSPYGNFVAGIDELAKRLGEAEKIAGCVLSLVDTILTGDNLAGNTYRGPWITSETGHSSLKSIFVIIREIITRSAGIEAAKVAINYINDLAKQAPVYNSSDIEAVKHQTNRP